MRLAVAAAAFGVVLAVAAPAGATAQPALHVTVGHPVEVNHAPIPVEEGAALYSTDHDYPEDCGASRVSMCDIIPVSYTAPPAARDVDLVLRFTLTWQSADNNLGFCTFRAVVDRDGREHRQPSEFRDEGTSPAVISVADPLRTRYDVRVANVSGTNTGYRLRVELVEEPLGLPHDYSADLPPAAPGAAAQPAASVTPPASAAGSATASDLLTTGDRLRISAAAPAHRPARRSVVGISLATGLLAIGALALAGLAVAGSALRRAATGDAQPRRLRTAIWMWMRNVRLFWKLLLPFLIIILVGGVTGAFFTVRYLSDRAAADLDRSLLQHSVNAEAYLRDREVALLDAERFAANVEGLPEALASANGAAAARNMESALSVTNDLDLLAATDAQGVGIVEIVRRSAGFVQSAGSDFATSLVGATLADPTAAVGTKQADLLAVDGRPLLAVAGPVRTDHVVGVMVAAQSVDAIVAGAAARANGPVAIFDLEGRRIGASGTTPTRAPRAIVDGTQPVRVSDRLAGRRVATAFAPLQVRGTRVGTYSVTAPADPAFASVRGARLRLSLLFMGVMASVLALGGLVSRSVLRRVNALVETNRVLGTGDLTVRAPVEGGDELGELALGFNVMAEQLEASYGEMERRVADRTEELQRLYQDVVRGNEARSDLFAAISHEFRTPLFAILAHAELMADPTLRPKGRAWPTEFAATITESAQLLLGRVNDILELAKLESTELALDLRPTAAGDAVDGVSGQVSALARRAGLTLDIAVADGLPLILADRDRVEQILLNLLSNAVKYNSDAGIVSLTVRAVAEGVQISVSDTGHGVPPEIGERIFEPFYQVREGTDATPPRLSSSGLGLAVTKRLVEAHHGTISFESVLGHGTTFRVVLPTATAAD
jgi:signal transduction histidine kinase